MEAISSESTLTFPEQLRSASWDAFAPDLRSANELVNLSKGAVCKISGVSYERAKGFTPTKTDFQFKPIDPLSPAPDIHIYSNMYDTKSKDRHWNIDLTSEVGLESGATAIRTDAYTADGKLYSQKRGFVTNLPDTIAATHPVTSTAPFVLYQLETKAGNLREISISMTKGIEPTATLANFIVDEDDKLSRYPDNAQSSTVYQELAKKILPILS